MECIYCDEKWPCQCGVSHGFSCTECNNPGHVVAQVEVNDYDYRLFCLGCLLDWARTAEAI